MTIASIQPTPYDKLLSLRRELAKLGVDGFILPHSDEYQSEYLSPDAECLAWLTGFTGSAGAAIVLPEKAAAFTDGRYLIQIEMEIDMNLYEVVDNTKAGLGDWLAARATAGQTIGYDAKLHTPSQIKALEKKIEGKNIKLVALPQNPLDILWTQRGYANVAPAEVFPESIAGTSSAEKRTTIAAQLKEKGVAAAVITLADSLAWLLNIRGQDIPHNPLVLSYAIIYADDARLDWFVDERKVTAEVRAHLGNAVSVKPHAEFGAALAALSGTVQVDFDKSSQWVIEQIKSGAATLKNETDPCIALKAIKTLQERDAMRAAHVRDGVALTKFLHWFAREAPKGELTELSAEAKLLEFRQQQSGFRMTSFDPIAGWAAHGAIVHYRAKPETDAAIKGDGLFLLDSGGQYIDGTTDVTRTIGVGNPTAEMKRSFTIVMKSHIALARAVFPEGATGAQLDGLTRAPLWEQGLEFSHGTGHGVGVYLCVHEDSVRISPRGHNQAKANMIVSNEPGFYEEGEYGIRCENLILSYDTGKLFSDGRAMLAFETITLAPFDRSLILDELLTEVERAWLNEYHQRVYDTLSPFLNADEKAWLKTFTA